MTSIFLKPSKEPTQKKEIKIERAEIKSSKLACPTTARSRNETSEKKS